MLSAHPEHDFPSLSLCYPICTMTILVTQLPLIAVTLGGPHQVEVVSTVPLQTLSPPGRQQPAGRDVCPALYLRILARLRQPRLLHLCWLLFPTLLRVQTLGSQGCQGDSLLSVSSVCLPRKRVALGGSSRSGRGRSWGRKGPRPVPGAH